MEEKKQKKFNPFVWFALAVMLGLLLYQFQGRPQGPPSQNLVTTEFFETVTGAEKKNLELLAVRPVDSLTYSAIAKLNLGRGFIATTLDQSDVTALKNWAKQEGISFSVEPQKQPSGWESALGWLLPIALLVVLWIFLMKRMQGGGLGGVGSVTKSRARTEIPSTKFTDVAGIDEAILEVTEVVDFLKNPTRFTKVGAKIPKGVILVGPPGTGKTLLARAVAGEAGVPFFSIGGSEFVEMYVGVGAGRVRDLFAEAKKSTPCIIFIDEIDAMGRARGAGVGQSHNEGEQTLNQLFTEMDGFDVNQGIIVLAATNRDDVLDKALLRPGRFDRHVQVGLPDVRGREAILKIHTRGKPLAEDVDLTAVARGTAGFSGADLEKLANEAAMLAAREERDEIPLELFWKSQNRIIMGEERRILIAPDEKKLVAYHEGGHAIVGAIMARLGCGEPVHQVTIIPRRSALGVTGFLPKEDRYLHSKAFCLGTLNTMLGGRLAEEIVFGKGKVTTGAGNDLHRATALVRKMVCDWGMSDNLPLRTYGERNEMVFLGRDLGSERDYSEKMAEKIDAEITEIIAGCTEEVRALLIAHRDKLDLLAAALLEKETLSGDEVRAIIGGAAENEAQTVIPTLPAETKLGKKDRIARWLKRIPFDFAKWAKARAKGKPWKKHWPLFFSR